MLEQAIQLVLRERIGLWLTGLAADLEGESTSSITDGSSGRIDEKPAHHLMETLQLTERQLAQLEVALVHELRSAARHRLIGGIWGELVDSSGILVIVRRARVIRRRFPRT